MANRIAKGRPRKQPPTDAAETILELAQKGYSQKGIARRLGTNIEIYNRWLSDYPTLQIALDEGREIEHQKLYNALFIQATEKNNAVAAMFLLKCRHGYREGDQTELANRVSIEFKLPAALPVDKFEVITGESNRV